MAEAALAALYRAVKTRLVAVTTHVWATRAYPDLAPANTARPYAIYAWAGGGELNAIVAQDAEIVLTVKVVAETLATAFTGAGEISALLNDVRLTGALALDGGSDWDILTCTQEQAVHLVENVDGVWLYHEGHRFRVRMERK